jgi:hypothetical protein
MEAIVINIQHHQERTPQQMVRSFLNTYQPETVELMLWEVFFTYAVCPERNLLGMEITDDEVASLFDGLNNLVTAAHALGDYFETG